MARKFFLQTLHENRKQLIQMEIHSLALFGSTARNELLPDRDIDLLVNLEPPYTFDACQKIQRFIPNIDYKQFIQDDRTYD